MAILTRKSAIMELAVPKQMQFMVAQGYPPTWEMFARSTGWQETIENLQLTKAEQGEYESVWRRRMMEFAEEGARL